MANYQEKQRSRFGAFSAKFSRFAKAAFILVLAVLVLGLCTVGTVKSSGDTFYAAKGAEVRFYLDYKQGKKLDKVYVNVGTIYEKVGSMQKLTFKRASDSNLTNPGWSTSYLGDRGEFKVGNIYSNDSAAVSSANYNWVEAFDLGKDGNKLTTTYNLFSVHFSCDMLVNEIVFVDEDGRVIPAYVTAESLKNIGGVDWNKYRDFFNGNENYADPMGPHKKYGDPKNLIDAQNSLSCGKTVYSNFTQDEAYTLMQIDHVLLGNFNPGGVFTANTDVGPLSILLPMLGVLIFGKSPFGLRFMPVLFTAALVGAAYFLGKRLFKKDGYGFLTAALAAFGGLAITVGRLGLAYSALAFLAVLSVLFMYKFFEDGVDGSSPVKSACGSVLASGLAFAAAFAADPKSVWLLIPLVFMFVCGMVRRSRAHKSETAAVRRELTEKNEGEKSQEVMLSNADECENRLNALGASYSYENRVLYLFFILAFIVATVTFVVLASLPMSYTYIRLYEKNPASPSLGIFTLIVRGVGDAFSLGNVTQYTAANVSSAFGWLIALKGATLFSASSANVYSAMNAQANLAMTLTALVGLVFMVSYTVLYFVSGGKKGSYASEHSSRILAVFAVIALCILSSLLSYAFAGQVSAAQSLTFQIFYFALIPLLFYTSDLHDGSAKSKVFGVSVNLTGKVLLGVCIVSAAITLLSVPMYFGIPVAPIAANACFGWTTFVNNGYYRV